MHDKNEIQQTQTAPFESIMTAWMSSTALNQRPARLTQATTKSTLSVSMHKNKVLSQMCAGDGRLAVMKPRFDKVVMHKIICIEPKWRTQRQSDVYYDTGDDERCKSREKLMIRCIYKAEYVHVLAENKHVQTTNLFVIITASSPMFGVSARVTT
jgi:hypothetical protein